MPTVSTALPIQAWLSAPPRRPTFLGTALCVSLLVNCAAPPHHYFRATATISPSSKTTDKPAPLSYLPNWQQAQTEGMTLTFRPPEKCLGDMSKSTVITSSLATCMPELATLESLASNAGYQIVSWQHLVGPYFLERASLFNVDVIVDVTNLEIQPVPAPAYIVDEIHFAWQQSMNRAVPLTVENAKDLGKDCEKHFTPLVESLEKPLMANLDVTLTSVADGRTIARYTQTLREDIEAKPIVRFYRAEGDTSKRQKRWRIGLALAGIGAGFLVGAGIAHRASVGVKAGLIGTGTGLFTVSIPITISKQSKVEYPPAHEVLCTSEVEHEDFPPASKKNSLEKDLSGTSFKPKAPRPSKKATLIARKTKLKNQLFSNLFESLGKAPQKEQSFPQQDSDTIPKSDELLSKDNLKSNTENQPSEDDIEIQADDAGDLIMDEDDESLDAEQSPRTDKGNGEDQSDKE